MAARLSLNDVDVVVAGHVCLDLTPTLMPVEGPHQHLFAPGGLTHVGPARLTLGGAVGNTGIALFRLGARTRLVGKIGGDVLGKTVLESLQSIDGSLAEHIIVDPNASTSYTIVISPPGLDRAFLHCPGANESFVPGDIALNKVEGARLVHFGYPPLMKAAYTDGGTALAARFHDIQELGALVSLDMALPDARAGSGQVDWRAWLRSVLPHVDLFMPSLDEMLLMLEPDLYARLGDRTVDGNRASAADAGMLTDLASELLEMGTRTVVLKLGAEGLYLKTGPTVSALVERRHWRTFDWSGWQSRELLAPCFEVDVASTTGAGDCTIAGFLMALLRGCNAAEAMVDAVAVGASSVETADGAAGLPSYDQVTARFMQGFKVRLPRIRLDGWSHSESPHVFSPPQSMPDHS
jgi:sugar/nucleoside kinase (ribokinase family)